MGGGEKRGKGRSGGVEERGRRELVEGGEERMGKGQGGRRLEYKPFLQLHHLVQVRMTQQKQTFFAYPFQPCRREVGQSRHLILNDRNDVTTPVYQKTTPTKGVNFTYAAQAGAMTRTGDMLYTSPSTTHPAGFNEKFGRCFFPFVYSKK